MRSRLASGGLRGALVLCATSLVCRAGPSVAPSEPARAAVSPVRTPRAAPCVLSAVGPDGITALERELRDAVRRARFADVVDLGPADDGACAASRSCRPIARRPHVDVAVIAFAVGCPPAYANAMLSSELPGVRLARIDPATLAVTGVRFRRWDPARWDRAAGAAQPARSAADDVVAPPPGEPAVDFALPYPASNFKLLVAIKVLELADRGAVRLADRFSHAGRSQDVRAWLDDMITWSDDEGAEAMLRMLHGLGEARRINGLFARLGLGTLQIHGTAPETGRGWRPGRMHMGAWDTARLLWLLDRDAPRPAWTAPDGAPVDTAFLRGPSKELLLGMLAEQAFHDVLSTTALCGRPHTVPGIPALLPARWIGDEGRVRLHGGDRGDARPCNATADVTFAHKTGLTWNFGSDAGIVRGIPGRARRHYIIAFFSNLGHRYTDADKAGGDPCRDVGVCYTQRIARMAGEIDAAIERSAAPHVASP
jgi:hypothetical protein